MFPMTHSLFKSSSCFNGLYFPGKQTGCHKKLFAFVKIKLMKKIPITCFLHFLCVDYLLVASKRPSLPHLGLYSCSMLVMKVRVTIRAGFIGMVGEDFEDSPTHINPLVSGHWIHFPLLHMLWAVQVSESTFLSSSATLVLQKVTSPYVTVS